jgi:hypothetical protein
VIDAACCVGEHCCVAAQEASDTNGEDDFLHGVTLIVVEAALQDRSDMLHHGMLTVSDVKVEIGCSSPLGRPLSSRSGLQRL